MLCLSLLAVGVAIPIGGDELVQLSTVGFIVLLPTIFGEFTRRKLLHRLALAAGLWAAAQVVSNAAFDMPVVSRIGLVGPVVVLLAGGMLWLQDRIAATANAVLGATAAGWVVLAATQGALASVNPWKFGLAPPCIVLVMAMCARASRLTQAFVLLALSAVSLAAESRFYALATAATAVALLSLSRRGTNLSSTRRLLGVTLIVGVVLYLGYPVLAEKGVFGVRVQAQQMLLESTGGYLLARNRPELLQSFRVVVNHPVLGIGSQGQLTRGESAEALQFASRFAGPLYDRRYLQGLDQGGRGFATHSQALNAASSAGVLALGFWVLLFLAIADRLRRLTLQNPAAPVLIFLGLLTGWDALFSPLAGLTHLVLATTVFLLCQTPGQGRAEAA